MKHSSPTYHVIIPSAGRGARFGGLQPKQYETIGKKTILEHSTAPFLNNDRITSICIAIPADDQIARTLKGLKDRRISFVEGGDTRTQSVLNSLLSLQNTCHANDWILVHDAARPCLSDTDLNNLLSHLSPEIAPHGAILGYAATDTLKTIQNSSIFSTVDRKNIWHALTPQAFPFTLLINALQRIKAEGVCCTDDASALELMGLYPIFIPGSKWNFKITHPEDIKVARQLLKLKDL
jgi:2-C-methyl-D-erythritol 4-phosphate cytidylyltransferase